MAFENAELHQMIDLSRNGVQVLLGALCVAGLSVVTDMTSDMLYDEGYVKDNGMPKMSTMLDMAIAQINVVMPDMVCDSGELDADLQLRDGEKPIEMLVRGIMTQILKQRPDLAKLEFQPR